MVASLDSDDGGSNDSEKQIYLKASGAKIKNIYILKVSKHTAAWVQI